MRRLTRAEAAKRFPREYELRSLDYGMQYYVAARFAAAAGHMPVAATLAHHALEAILKAAASRGATKQQILRFKHTKGNFGHDLGKLWAAFKAQHPGLRLYGFKSLIVELDKFEKIRFAEQLMERETMIQVSYVTPPKSPPQPRRMRRFMLRVDLLDKLVRTILEAMNIDPPFFSRHYNGPESAHYYKLRNRHRF
jgi:hypothetical protein